MSCTPLNHQKRKLLTLLCNTFVLNKNTFTYINYLPAVFENVPTTIPNFIIIVNLYKTGVLNNIIYNRNFYN